MKSSVELLSELIDQVEKMRKEQRRYFLKRDNLDRAKKEEERLDHLVIDIKHVVNRLPTVVQKSLFESDHSIQETWK